VVGHAGWTSLGVDSCKSTLGVASVMTCDKSSGRLTFWVEGVVLCGML
jgi:hypothetical protein